MVHHLRLEGLLSGEPMHVNVHEPGPGKPPPVTCADLTQRSGVETTCEESLFAGVRGR